MPERPGSGARYIWQPRRQGPGCAIGAVECTIGRHVIEKLRGKRPELRGGLELAMIRPADTSKGVALFLPFLRNKRRQGAASVGTKRRRKTARFYRSKRANR
jgi:hypothetical protein